MERLDESPIKRQIAFEYACEKRGLYANVADRPSKSDYIDWHSADQHEDLRSADLEARFNANSGVLLNSANAHPFMNGVSVGLAELLEQGVLQIGDGASQLVLIRKPFASVIDKIYRHNCLWNRQWPNPPKDNWLTYADSYQRLDDIIRGTIICRYLDGPEHVSELIKSAAEEAGLTASFGPRATDAGYYAWHTYVEVPAQVFIGADLADIRVTVEIQTTTVLQSALRELTHKLYEVRRQSVEPRRAVARWDYASDQFRAEYLGHTLHLVDAMILELRNAQTSDENSEESQVDATGN